MLSFLISCFGYLLGVCLHGIRSSNTKCVNNHHYMIEVVVVIVLKQMLSKD